MKKLLVAVLALTTASAFAGNMNMIKMDGCFDGQCDSLDLAMGSDDADKKNENQTIALNYSRSFGKFGAGIKYITKTDTKDGEALTVGDKMNTIGLSGYYNMAGEWENSCFVGLHYDMTTNDDTAVDDSGNKVTTITLEYGHRFTIGAIKGHTFSWVPSVTYAMGTTDYSSDADDLKTTALALNMANVALTF
jgi:hypothetical protein